jgi:hypothetical protein
MFRSNPLRFLVFFALALAACGPQGGADLADGALQTWIDAPLNNSAIPEENYTIVFSGASFGDPIGNFEVLVNGSPEGVIPAAYQNYQGDAHYSYAEYAWLPPAPGNYLIQVRALSGDLAGTFAEANVFVGNLGEETASADEGLEGTPEGELQLVAIPIQNVNCRYGNSNQFEIADTLFEGQAYRPDARGNDNLWVRFLGPVAQVQCWVFVDNLDLLLNDEIVELVNVTEALLPYASYPATTTPSPTPTFAPEPSATAAPRPQCDDGIDNDGDGDIDMADGRCLSPDDDSENS